MMPVLYKIQTSMSTIGVKKRFLALKNDIIQVIIF